MEQMAGCNYWQGENKAWSERLISKVKSKTPFSGGVEYNS